MAADRPVRLGYLVSHPIQYQAPMLRRIAQEPGIDLKALFMSDFSLRSYRDEGFGVAVEWDVPLTDGYDFEMLPRRDDDPVGGFWWPGTRDLGKHITRERMDVLWLHGYHSYTHLHAMVIARRRGIPTMVRCDSQLEGVLRGKGWKKVLKDRGVAGVFRLPCAFLTVGEANADYYRSMGVEEHKLFSIPYAIDNDRFRQQALEAVPHNEKLRRELGLQPGRPVILFASKLQFRKRILDLLAAFDLAKDRLGERRPYLIVVGDGEERAALEAAVDERRLRDDVRTVGFQNQSVLPRYFTLCDVFVLPSAREPYGLIVNEVMCASRAVIVSDEVGAAPDLVFDGDNGYIFPVGDVDRLADRLVEVLADPAVARRMGERSWEIVQKWDFEADIVGLKKALAALGHPVPA